MAGDVLTELVDRAASDPEFRRRALDDLEGTLAAEGYALSDEELAAVRDLHAQAAGLPDDEIDRQLVEASERRQGS